MRTSLRRDALLSILTLSALLLLSPEVSSARGAPLGTPSTVVQVSNTRPLQGAKITLRAAGFQPREAISVDILGPVVHIGDSKATRAGDVSVRVATPNSMVGRHIMTITGLTSGRVRSVAITIRGSANESAPGAAIVGAVVAVAALLLCGALVLASNRRSRRAKRVVFGGP